MTPKSRDEQKDLIINELVGALEKAARGLISDRHPLDISEADWRIGEACETIEAALQSASQYRETGR